MITASAGITNSLPGIGVGRRLPGVRSAQLGAQKAYPVNPPVLVQLKRHRLDVKLKERPLFAGVFDLFFEPGMLASSRR